MAQGEWIEINPPVDTTAEFFEIVNDFGNPLELVREAISNAIDWKASYIKIAFTVEQIDGARRLVITLEDDGTGMNADVLQTSFWGLGHSESRKLKSQGVTDIVGEKGHGTKIYLRSEKVIVQTQSIDGAFESICENPLRSLSSRTIHKPLLRQIDNIFDEGKTGTIIKVIGYNDNERASFIQEIVKDYIQWFTKAGSIELIFGHRKNENFKVLLKCIGTSEYEEVQFGHVFPKEQSDIEKLFKEKEFDAADYYVKYFIYKDEKLKNAPEVTFDVIVSIEGDQIKREYNSMIRDRMRSDTGRYKVSDRYGVYLCKDYIPIVRINDWISGFGTGSNSMTMVHGFINCQELKLTANRGTISNTDPKILEELRSRIQEIFNDIDSLLHEKGIYTLRDWQRESTTLNQETAEYTRRIKSIKNKKKAIINSRSFLEPQNESELFGTFMSIYSMFPDYFVFEPLDYNTTKGVDLIARNKTTNQITDSEFWYVELKFILKKEFNHAFRHLRWILCWDFDKKIDSNTEFFGVEESDMRKLKTEQIELDEGATANIYFLENRLKANRIEIIRLKEFLKDRLGIEFQ